MRHLLLLLLATLAVAADATPTARQRTSWLAIDEAACNRTLVEGQQVEVAVDYCLSEGPAAKLVLSGHGPWIDLPDGRIETKRHHVDYPGLYASAEVQPGRGRHVFTFTVPKLHGRDSLLWIARFTDAGKAWPWERRLHGGTMAQADPALRLVPAAPGSLFTYAEPLRFGLAFGSAAKPGTQVDAAWRIIGRDGSAVAEGKTSVAVPAAGATAALEIPCQRRGTFGLSVSVEGVGAAEGSFARVPDVMATTKGEPTRFGFHDIAIIESDAAMDAQFAMARRLGLTFCRVNLSWKHIEPARGEWRLDGLDRAIAMAARHGIAPMLNIHDPPAWAATRRCAAGFDPFAFDEAGWSEAITHLSRRYKGRIAAWEWLNEIVPGPEEDPVGIYLNMVRLGNAAAKAEDPKVLSVLAGGLWPRSFRLGLLAAGVGQHIDALPIHYGDAAGITEAAGDLAAASAPRVQVWDDETSAGTSTWRMPLGEAMAQTDQRAWAMDRFPGQLSAGAQRIIWFGQGRDPAGNWDYAWDYDSPRPIAATLAVLAAKLHRAEPLGGFAIGDSGRFDLFAVGGRAVLVAPASKAGLRLRVGSDAVTISDDQGEESRVAAQGGDAALPACPLPVFVEGGDLEVLRGYTVPELLTPQISLLAGGQEPLRVRLTNRSAKPLDCTLAVGLPEGWPKSASQTFRLAPTSSRLVEIPIAVPARTPGADHRLQLACTYADARMPRVSLPWQLAVIDPKRLGNLLDDGGFEKSGAAWGPNETCKVETADGFAEGLGAKLLHMSGPVGWKSVSQAQVLPAGRTYLYSAWVRVADKRQAGSNIDQRMNDGSVQPLYIPQVFSAANVPGWQFLSKIYEAPKDLMMVNFSPVANGEAFYDNVRLTAYEGSNFAAEAVRAAKAPAIDGDLADWAAGWPCDPAAATCDSLDEVLAPLCLALVRAHIPFHFADELLLAAHGSAADGRLRLGAGAYRHVIVPPWPRFETATLDLLRRAAADGVRIHRWGAAPAIGGDPHPDLAATVAALPQAWPGLDGDVVVHARLVDGRTVLLAGNCGDRERPLPPPGQGAWRITDLASGALIHDGAWPKTGLVLPPDACWRVAPGAATIVAAAPAQPCATARCLVPHWQLASRPPTLAVFDRAQAPDGRWLGLRGAEMGRQRPAWLEIPLEVPEGVRVTALYGEQLDRLRATLDGSPLPGPNGGHPCSPDLQRIACPLEPGRHRLRLHPDAIADPLEDLIIEIDGMVEPAQDPVHGWLPRLVPWRDPVLGVDLARQGLPFHWGAIDFVAEVTLDDPAATPWLELGAAAGATAVSVDGASAGCLWHAPWRLDLGRLLHRGLNRLGLRCLGTAQNLLGPHRVPDAGVWAPQERDVAPPGDPYHFAAFGVLAVPRLEG